MNESHYNLWEQLRNDGLYSKSYEDFTMQFSQPDAQNRLWKQLSADGLYSKGAQDFHKQFFFSGPSTEPQVSDSALEAVSMEPTSDTIPAVEAPSGDSVSPLTTEEKPREAVRQGFGLRDTFTPPARDLDREILSERLEKIPEVNQERQYLTGLFGDAINSLGPFGDFIDDMFRSYGKGEARRETVENTFQPIILSGDIADEDISNFVNAVNKSDELVRGYGESDEMLKFNQVYEQEGGGVWGFLAGVSDNPSILPSVLVESFSGMANEESAKAALAANVAGLGAGAAVGATGGPLAPITVPSGALAGYLASFPLAFGAAGGIQETTMSFVEFLKEELGDKEFNLENVSEILRDEDKLAELRKRSLLRGGTIGTVDAMGGAVINKSLKAAKTLSGTAKAAVGTGGEAVTGGAGEALARAAAGQEQDVQEILFEATAGLAQAPVTLGQTFIEESVADVEAAKKQRAINSLNEALQNLSPKSSYKLNGEEVSREQFQDMLGRLTDEEFKQVNIEVSDDPEIEAALDERVNNIEINSIIPEEIQGGDRARLVTLEKELQKVEGKPGATSKKRFDQIKSEIETILDKYEVVPTTEVAQPTEQVADVEPEITIDAEAVVANTASKVETVKASTQEAEDGATFNLDGSEYAAGGLVVPVISMNTTQENVSPEMILEFVNQNLDKIGDADAVKVGIYKFPNSDQVSIDLNIVVPTDNRAVALEFGKLAGQESLFDLDASENVKTGATGEAPMSFTPEQFKEIATSLKNNELPAFIKGEVEPTPQVIKGDVGKVFSQPVDIVQQTASEYISKAGIDVAPGERILEVNVDQAKRIADAYDAMQNAPNDPEVRAAYEALSKETLDQYQSLLDSDVKVEVFEGEGEPYKSSAEMLADLRDNNHLFVLSTEKDFGTTGITPEQRAENPLLKDSGFKDVNGVTLLVNDVFRAVHDFFGHGERGNSFGPIGEENAWDVHSRMYSPLARRAMTSETRGQNSWVNFGPQMRNEKGEIIKKGEEGYLTPADREFAPQKMGLLPEEFSQVSERVEPTVEAKTEPAPTSVAEQLEQEGVYIREKGLVSKADSLRRRFFTARKHLPKTVFKMKEKQEARVAKQMNIVEQNIAEFNRLLNKVKGDEAKRQFINDFDDALRGGEGLSRLNEEAQELVISMRNQIDVLSVELVNQGLVSTGPGVDKIISNLGQYLNRSYKVFDRKDWKSQVTEELITTAKNYLRPRLEERARQQVNDPAANIKGLEYEAYLESLVDAEIEKYLDPKQAEAYVSAGVGKDLNILKERQDIPKELRALMGEYTAPVENYAKSVLRMAATVETQAYLNKVAKFGEGKFLYKGGAPTGIFTTKIENTGSNLDGLYTTPEIANEFKKSAESTNSLLEAYMKLVSTTKYTKTILSIGTHGKNVFGNLGFMWANGHTFNPLEAGTEMAKAYQTLYNDFRKGDSKVLNERMNEYIELGIVKQSASLGEIRAMFKDANLGRTVEERLNNQKIGVKNLTLKKAKDAGKFMEDLYQAEDDFFKIVAFEIEKNRYSEALFGKPKSELTAEESAKVDEYVAGIVKNTYPTYSRVPEAISLLRRSPLIGNFVSFQAESYRVSYNTLALGLQEMRSENKEVRKIGAKRLLGAISYVAGKSYVLAKLSAAVGAASMGVIGSLYDTEEEKRRLKDVRLFSPPWTKNSSIAIRELGDGKIVFVDVSASDPYGNYDKIVNAFLEGEDLTSSFANGLYQIIEPFVGTEIATRRLGNLAYNRKDSGADIYNPESSFEQQTADIIQYLYEGILEPGTIKSAKKVAGTESKLEELIGQFTGLKPYRIDIKEQLGYKLRDLNNSVRDAKKLRYKDVAEAEEQLYKVEQEIQELLLAAERLGVPRPDVYNIVKEARISKENYLRIRRGGKPKLEAPDGK